MMKKIAIGFVAVLAVFLGVVALQSPHYTVSRSVIIQAPPAKIFPYLINARLAEQWAPWPEVDPKAKMEYSGPESGVGSKTSWASDGQLGTGSATITQVEPGRRVGIQLEYTKPMQMSQYSEYLIDAGSAEGQTVVTWTVRGENSFPGRVMCVFMNMDKMVGGMFEKGLGNLKRLAERQ